MENLFVESEELEKTIKSKKDLFDIMKYNRRLIRLLFSKLNFLFYSLHQLNKLIHLFLVILD